MFYSCRQLPGVRAPLRRWSRVARHPWFSPTWRACPASLPPASRGGSFPRSGLIADSRLLLLPSPWRALHQGAVRVSLGRCLAFRPLPSSPARLCSIVAVVAGVGPRGPGECRGFGPVQACPPSAGPNDRQRRAFEAGLGNAYAGLCSLWAAGSCQSIPVFVTGGGAAFLLPVLLLARPPLSVAAVSFVLAERVRAFGPALGVSNGLP